MIQEGLPVTHDMTDALICMIGVFGEKVIKYFLGGESGSERGC